MDRFVLTIPSEARRIYTTNLQVRISDLNYGGHLGHDRLVTLAHEVRMEYLRKISRSEIDFLGTNKGLIATDVCAIYSAEGHYADELEVSTFFQAKGLGFNFFYRFIKKIDAQKSKELGLLRVGLLLYDYDLKKVLKNPKELNEIIETFH